MARQLATTQTRSKTRSRNLQDRGQVATVAPAASKTQIAVLCLLIAAAVVVLYFPATAHPFLGFDDSVYVTANRHVRAGLTWNTIRWAFVSTEQANWHPLTWLSHAMDAQLFGMNAAGHHAVNILFHTLNSVLLFLLLRWITGRLGPSLLVAALFAWHPLNVESVAWIAERKNVLSTFFFLATLAAYIHYAQKPETRRYLAVVLLFVLGLLAKPMIVTLPFVLLLLDYWPLSRFKGMGPSDLGVPQWPASKLILEKLPLLFLSTLSAVVTIVAQRAGNAVRSVAEFSFAVRIENAITAYALYLWRIVWPANLAPLYPHPGNTLRAWQWLIALLVIVLISQLVFKFRKTRYLTFGWLWFLGTLVPVIGLVQVGDAAMADRYSYIPTIGVFIMLVWSVADWAVARQMGWRSQWIPAICLLLALAFTTRNQLTYWHSDYDLWAHTVTVTKNNFIAEHNLGGACLQLGRPDEAREHFQAALKINPHDPLSLMDLAIDQYKHGQTQEALANLALAGQFGKPSLQSLAYTNQGRIYFDLGEYEKAGESYARALQADPTQPYSYICRGVLSEKEGNLNNALQDYARAIELEPSDEAYARLGHVLQLTNRPDQALAAYQEALNLSPKLKDALAPFINSAITAARQNR
jgi:protein O-mannosyl-transferase